MAGLRAMLREARYALPLYAERVLPGPGPAATVRLSDRLNRRGFATTLGYFQAAATAPDEIVEATVAAARLLGESPRDAYLSVKAHPLGFDPGRVRTIADAAASAGLSLMFDAQAAEDGGRVMELVERLLPDFPATGAVIPARWRRSIADAERFRDTSLRIRIVKGERADPEWGERDAGEAYLGLVEYLAGRAAPVGVATHDPALAERALGLLLAAGTPCELEQLRGLPRRRTVAVARRLGVPVRVYLPFGPGWWPYALDKALARPYLLKWMIRDRFATPARQSPPIPPRAPPTPTAGTVEASPARPAPARP